MFKYRLSYRASSKRFRTDNDQGNKIEDHNYVREVNPATSEARQRTDEETENEYVEPVESVVLTYVEGDSLKYKHNAIRLGC